MISGLTLCSEAPVCHPPLPHQDHLPPHHLNKEKSRDYLLSRSESQTSPEKKEKYFTN